ncbi:hypothetical protein Tco_0046360 [Tanacetum coccineum]
MVESVPSPVCWTEVEKLKYMDQTNPRDSLRKSIRSSKMQAARDRQKSYTDLKRKPMEFYFDGNSREGLSSLGARRSIQEEISTPIHQDHTVVKCCISLYFFKLLGFQFRVLEVSYMLQVGHHLISQLIICRWSVPDGL